MRVPHQLRTAATGLPYTWPPKPRILYFDIDGTLVRPTFGRAKSALADGRFERLVRRAGFDGVVCVSDAVLLARALLAQRAGYGDVHRVLHRFCQGTIEDRYWFRTQVKLAADPTRRAEEIDFAADWFYVDDSAYLHLARARRFGSSVVQRTLLCDRRGEGEDVAAWLKLLAEARPPHGGGDEGFRRYELPASDRSSYARRRE